MYRRIGLLATALAIVVMLNAGPARAQSMVPQVATGGVQNTLGGKPIPAAVTPSVTNPQTAVACNLCFTCGGDWPIFAGFQSNGTSPADERGGACGGGFTTSLNDHNPFLCCR